MNYCWDVPLVRVLLVITLLLSFADAARAQLVVLTPTGESRDGLPVVRPHPDAGATTAVLTRGYSGRLLRLYALEQEFLRRRTGGAPEPAYLVLSDRQGGFPQFGFYLGDDKKPDAGWVDLHRSSRVSGRFGAMDQIFPHELLHVIVRQLAGAPRESGGNQMHAVGVRSDAVNAFAEGFAEHAQIMAVDDPDAVDDTRALPRDVAVHEQAKRAVEAYVRDLGRSWWPIHPTRIRFLLWFSQTEQVLRYHAVKANAFAREPAALNALIAREDKYAAYLCQSVVPGAVVGAAKPAGVMLATDGPVAHLFWRVVTDPSLQQRYRDEAFYASFGVTRHSVTPLDNVYLKMFFVLYDQRPSTAAEMLQAWARVLPEDRADLDRVTREALLGQALPTAPEIWLANEAFVTGTSLFDQYRALPRMHTFDVNAATTLDWLTVPGVTPAMAARLIADAPYQTVDALAASAVLSDATRARVLEMSTAMARLRERAAREEETLSLWVIARSYLWRLGAIALVATIAGAWLARRAEARRVWTATLIALASTLIVITLAWIVTSPVLYPFVAPVVIGGGPWAAWRLARRQGLKAASLALLTWALAAGPALVLVR